MTRRKGFTLIELLVVIAIIGILATLVITQLAGARVKARNASARSDVTEAGKAIEVFKSDDNSSENVIDASDLPSAADAPTVASGKDCTLIASPGACHSTALNYQTPTTPLTWNTIFAGNDVSPGTATGNKYGVQFSKTPSGGYIYYYMSADVGASATAAGSISTASGTLTNSAPASSSYYFIADIGSNGAQYDATNRYYYVHNGNSGANGSTAQGFTPVF